MESKMQPAIFSNRLRATRQKKRLSQKELAAAIHITPAALSNYEATDDKKRKIPTVETACNLAMELGVSLGWLCGAEDNLPSVNTRRPLSYYIKLMLELENANIGHLTTIDGSYDEQPRAEFIIYHGEIVDFVSAKYKITALYNDGTITAQMYEEWLSGALSKYDRVELSPKKISSEAEPFQEVEIEDDLPY